jgi:hypothetical protein
LWEGVGVGDVGLGPVAVFGVADGVKAIELNSISVWWFLNPKTYQIVLLVQGHSTSGFDNYRALISEARNISYNFLRLTQKSSTALWVRAARIDRRRRYNSSTK